jgi:ribosomal protein L32
MAGKALKDVTALNRCSACGHVKRAHLLCPYCVKGWYIQTLNMVITNFEIEIQGFFKNSQKTPQSKTKADKPEDQ